MLKKYFIFISSGTEDVKTERRELIRIVSELGAVPVTMDEFDISQKDDRRIIYKAIEECDYFLNLTAYKGGKAVGKSFALEAECAHAAKAEIPILALIIDEKARWKATKKEKNASAAKALESFKKKLKNHAFDTWTGLADLKQKALELLCREMNLNPRTGWVPSTGAVEPSVANELGRLIRENNLLKTQVKMGGAGTAKKAWEYMKHVLRILALNRISLSFYYTDGQNWENSKSFRYLRLYRLIAPELSLPKTAVEISRFLGNVLNPNLEKTVRKDYPVPSNTVKKLMADLTALKLVRNTPNVQKGGEAWVMTEYGNETYAAYRLRHMEKILSKK